MMTDLFLFVLGLGAGSCVAAYWLVRALSAEADLRDAQARLERQRLDLVREHAELVRLEGTIDGRDVRTYFPRPLTIGGRRG
jgi:hypothetical protein